MLEPLQHIHFFLVSIVTGLLVDSKLANILGALYIPHQCQLRSENSVLSFFAKRTFVSFLEFFAAERAHCKIFKKHYQTIR